MSYVLDTNDTDDHAGPRGVEYHRPQLDRSLVYLFEVHSIML